MQSDRPAVHVIDDDEAVRQSLAFLLGAAGIEVRTYESAVAFLKAAPAAEVGCVVTDVRMPEVSGIELLRRLKELGLEVPVILITGHGDVPLAVEAMKIGAADFLEKPFDDEVLLTSVRSALDRHGRDSRRQAERAQIEARLATLSNRERNVLDGLLVGQANKQIAFFSDAYCVEWTYGKWLLVRRLLAAALAARVQRGQYRFDEAVSIAKSILYESPQSLLGMTPRGNDAG